MSDRLRISLVAGIITVQIQQGRLTDPRYTASSPEWNLDNPQWQEMPVNPPAVEFFPHNQDYASWRNCMIRDNLLNRRDNLGGHSPLAHEVIFYAPERFPGVLGFRVQEMPDIDLIGFALATIEERYGQAGLQALPTYQGRYRPISSLVPPDIQELQRNIWAYGSFSDRMPGYFYTFHYLCGCLGFRLDPEDYVQVKLYLCWDWH